MRVAPEGRLKWECYRLLATLRLDPARTQLIGGFIESYLQLDEREEAEFLAELKQVSPEERSAIMEWNSIWHKQGRLEGRQQEAANLVERLLRKRLGPDAALPLEAIRALPLERLEELAEAIFEIGTEADLEAWLRRVQA